MVYRSDIDFLRAVAVLSVVLFHLDIRGFQGGFVGVDVFFVISGYLITSIIQRKYENQNFKFSDFYSRRIRRLVPPLIATIAATLFVASFILMPYSMVQFARSAAAALFSLSNIVFYTEAGYWDSASELKPLLHTWSLGVEEQFYLFWPALILGLLAVRRYVSFGVSLALISIFGAALNIWYTSIDESATFYLLPFRVFQFSVGAWLLPLTINFNCDTKRCPAYLPAFAFWSGTLCIALGVIALGENGVSSEWSILLPTVGAALFLSSGALPGQLDRLASGLVQNPLAIWVGRVSYSMYLVHWPIIALYRYHYGLELSVADQVILAVGTVLATCALHYGVERRFYRRRGEDTKHPIVASDGRFALRVVIVAGLLALVSSSAWLGNGWEWRTPSLIISAEDVVKASKAWTDSNKYACNLRSPPSDPACNVDAEIQILFLGNSHRVDAYNFIKAGYGDGENINLIIFKYKGKCDRFNQFTARSTLESADEDCQRHLDTLFESAVLPHLDIVVYAEKTPYAKPFSLAILRQLKAINPEIQVVTFGGYIQTNRPCPYYVNRARTLDACAFRENISFFAGDKREPRLIKEYKDIESHYIDRVDLLCENRVLETCRTRTDNGVPMLYDKDHNSIEFSQMSGRMYARKYPDLIRELVNR